MPKRVYTDRNLKELEDKIFALAEKERFMIDIAFKLEIQYPNLYYYMRKLGIVEEIKQILQKNREADPKCKYSKEEILTLAGTSISLNHMGKRLKRLCRERIRQILELYDIDEEVHLMFKLNKRRAVELLEKSEPLKVEVIHEIRLDSNDTVLQ